MAKLYEARNFGSGGMTHTPWSDVITLIYRSTVQDADGFETVTWVKSDPPLFCDFTEGVSQSEFYHSMRAGTAASAQAEVQTADYESFWPDNNTDYRFAEFLGKRYRILRSFPQSFDTTTIILTEVFYERTDEPDDGTGAGSDQNAGGASGGA